MSQTLKPKKGYKIVTLTPKVLKFVIPEDWNFVKFNKLTKQITDGTHFTPKYKKSGLPFLRVTDIQTKNIDWESVKKISIDEHKELIKRCKPEKGDILYSKNGTVGITKIIDWDKEFSIFVSLCLIKPLSQKISTDYLYWILLSKIIKMQMQSRSKQLSVQNLHLEEIRDFDIPLPTLLEQQKIAIILSNIKNLITNTKTIIDQTKSIKKGLMQKLLVRGIGHKKFKNVKWYFGKEVKIAEEWNAVSLKEVSVNGLKNGIFKRRKDYGAGVPLVNVSDLFSNDVIKLEDLEKVQVTKQELDQFGLSEGDIFFCRSSLVMKGIGQSNIVQKLTEPSVFECHVMMLRSNQMIIPKFLFYFTRSFLFRQIITSIAMTLTMTTIRQPDLETILILLPKVKEQQKIVSILSNIDNQIQSQTQYKEKLERLKKSLMQKLLTGQVRIAV